MAASWDEREAVFVWRAMNREIKFRVWDVDAEEMVPVINLLLTPEVQVNRGGSFYQYPVMQFTGLMDRKWKEVYEGDIVKIEVVNLVPHYGVERNEFIREVVYVPEIAAYHPFNDGLSPIEYGEGMGTFIEVIGNIYENPALLEKL